MLYDEVKKIGIFDGDFAGERLCGSGMLTHNLRNQLFFIVASPPLQAYALSGLLGGGLTSLADAALATFSVSCYPTKSLYIEWSSCPYA